MTGCLSTGVLAFVLARLYPTAVLLEPKQNKVVYIVIVGMSGKEVSRLKFSDACDQTYPVYVAKRHEKN